MNQEVSSSVPLLGINWGNGRGYYNLTIIMNSQRTIKFRAWDTKFKRWFVPTFRAYKGELCDLHITIEGQLLLRTIDGFEHESLFEDRFIIGQYTGLKDKNGKEIYEGDIVEWRKYHSPYKESQTEELSEVEKLEIRLDINVRSFQTMLALNHSEDDVEVIGNIYENKELLDA